MRRSIGLRSEALLDAIAPWNGGESSFSWPRTAGGNATGGAVSRPRGPSRCCLRGWRGRRPYKIGRGAGRGRGEISVGAGSLKKKKKNSKQSQCEYKNNNLIQRKLIR